MRTSNRLIRFLIVAVLIFLVFCTAAVIQNWDTLSAALTNMVMTLSGRHHRNRHHRLRDQPSAEIPVQAAINAKGK